MIPKFVRRLVNGMPVCIHGDGANSRHYIFVEDVARAFVTILHKGVRLYSGQSREQNASQNNTQPAPFLLHTRAMAFTWESLKQITSKNNITHPVLRFLLQTLDAFYLGEYLEQNAKTHPK